MMSFQHLQSLVRLCTEAGGPTLYRALYDMDTNAPFVQIENTNDWEALPFLTKDSLLETTLKERCFASSTDIDHFRVSSGTSGKPPLFTPRTSARGVEYRLAYHNFKNAILAYTTPAMPHWHEALQESLGHTPHVIVFDPKQPHISVRLARIAEVDSISVFAFHIPIIGALMQKEHLSNRIRFIEICGETCSRALFEYIHITFPNAVLLPQYGSGEVENIPMGIPCRAITGEEPLSVYHVKDTQYHELIDPDTGAVIPRVRGAEGELVLTSYPGNPAALPLIRYRTGDMIRILDTCEVHHELTFTVLGRARIDFLKIPGGMLRIDEIERVLENLGFLDTDTFELHLSERVATFGPRIEVVLHIGLKNPTKEELESAALCISEHLRVGPSRTYAEGVADGMYAPLTCCVLSSAKRSGKHKRMISHIR